MKIEIRFEAEVQEKATDAEIESCLKSIFLNMIVFASNQNAKPFLLADVKETKWRKI